MARKAAPPSAAKVGAKKSPTKKTAKADKAKKPAKRRAEPAPEPARGRGRPSTFTEAIAREIVERLSEGEPLANICRSESMPGLSTVYDWMDANETFSGRIARAREAGFDMIAAETLRIADTPQVGVIEKLEANEKGEMVVVERKAEDMLGHRRLQIDTRMKLLSKWDPRRYGEKVQVGGDPENPAPVGIGVVMIPAKRQDGE
jgi:hypothetical protein